MRCAVMVLNWNGAAELRESLPGVLAAAQSIGAEVWVVDNASEDDSREVCRSTFPNVRFEALAENRSLAAFNVAAERCDADVFVALNNDVLVQDDFLPPLLRHFAPDGDVFAVSSSIRSYSDGGDAGVATDVRWRRGMLRGNARTEASAMPVFYNCGAATAYDRCKFVELGGFDDLFFPLYYEDTDISWRAWKRGWRCLCEPESVVYHKDGGTIGRSKAVTALVLRNEFLFHWKNLSDPSLIAGHVATTIPRLAVALLRRDTARLRGFADAMRLLPAALVRRRAVRAARVLGDRSAMERVNSPRQGVAP